MATTCSDIALKNAGGLYEIRNILTGHVYIGSTYRFGTRLSRHRTDLRAGRHPNRHLQSAWRKYGEAAFHFSPLAVLERDDQLATEQRMLDAVHGSRLCYNIGASATAAMLGRAHSATTREKMSRAQKGRVKSPTECQHISAAQKGKPRPWLIQANVGRKRADLITEETRAKCRAAHIGKPMPPRTDEHRARISAAMTGRPWSAARRAAQEARQRRSA